MSNNSDNFDKEQKIFFRFFFFIWTTLFLFIMSVGIFSCWVIYKILEHFQIVQ